MSINQYQPIIGTTGQVTGPSGNFFFMISATAAVKVVFEGGLGGASAIEEFDNVGGGLYLLRVKPWKKFTILGVNGTTINYFAGSQSNREDITDYKLSIATITGVANTQNVPSSVINDNAAVSPTVLGQHALFPVNVNRRRITVYSDSTNAGDAQIFLRKAGGVNDLGFIVPGTFQEFDTTAAMDYRAPNGGDKLYLFEEQ